MINIIQHLQANVLFIDEIKGNFLGKEYSVKSGILMTSCQKIYTCYT